MSERHLFDLLGKRGTHTRTHLGTSCRCMSALPPLSHRRGNSGFLCLHTSEIGAANLNRTSLSTDSTGSTLPSFHPLKEEGGKRINKYRSTALFHQTDKTRCFRLHMNPYLVIISSAKQTIPKHAEL